jgi:hypothetical protein
MISFTGNTTLEELIKKSNEVKIELDKTPFEDEKKLISLLRKLLVYCRVLASLLRKKEPE